MTALTATLMLCACSESTGTPTAHITTASQQASSIARPASAPSIAPVPMLRVPRRVPGEISRTVVTTGHGPVLHTTTLRDHRAGDRNYVVKAACSASESATTLDYVLSDASSSSKSREERMIFRGTIPCDGHAIAGSVGLPAATPVTVDFGDIPDDLSQAYAVVVPE